MEKLKKIFKIVLLALIAVAVVLFCVIFALNTFSSVIFLVFGVNITVLLKYVLYGVLVLAVIAWIIANLPAVLEFIRKFVVSLKRSPQTIPMVLLLVTFVIYSMNLTKFSNTTALVQGSSMGLCQFVMMLFTLLSLVCMLNAFPKRKKANILMIVLMFVMFAACIFSATVYQGRIMAAITRAESPIDPNKNVFVAQAYNTLNVYIVMLLVSAGLVVLLPVYSKLLRMIKTSIDVEGNGEMEQLELSE